MAGSLNLKKVEELRMKLADLISVIVYDYLWGLPLVVLILGTGVYITVRTGFFQFRCFGMSMKHAFNSIFHREKKDENDTGVLSPLEAMSTALGTTIGVGNIGGVASAIAVGGPGAVFWMCRSFIFTESARRKPASPGAALLRRRGRRCPAYRCAPRLRCSGRNRR